MTQKQKILAIMAREPDKWFFPYEFMRSDLGQYFVGYKAPTRLNELEHDYPGMFLRKPDGKYIKRKLDMAGHKGWFYTLPKELRAVVYKTGVIPRESEEDRLARLGYKLSEN